MPTGWPSMEWTELFTCCAPYSPKQTCSWRSMGIRRSQICGMWQCDFRFECWTPLTARKSRSLTLEFRFQKTHGRVAGRGSYALDTEVWLFAYRGLDLSHN